MLPLIAAATAISASLPDVYPSRSLIRRSPSMSASITQVPLPRRGRGVDDVG